MSQVLSRSLILTFLLSLFAASGFSQKSSSKWFYLATTMEGWKFYYQKDIQKLKNGNLAFWSRVVYLDESSMEIFQEWDCSQKRYRRLQAISFSPTNELLFDNKNLNWDFASPDSISATSFSIVCEQANETRLIEVISPQAKLRSLPNKNATILRTAKKGNHFALSLAKPVSGWYNIVDEETQEDYWIYGNAIRIIEK